MASLSQRERDQVGRLLSSPLDLPAEHVAWIQEMIRLTMRTSKSDLAVHSHTATEVTVDTTTLEGTSTVLQGVLEELDDAIAAIAFPAAWDVSVDSANLVGVATDVQGVLEELDDGIADHLADTVGAHAASAVAFTPNGSIAATNVQAAIVEVRDEAASGAMSLGFLIAVAG